MIRVLFLVRTTSEFDKMVLMFSKCNINSLKITKDEVDWFIPTSDNLEQADGCGVLENIRVLKIGYSIPAKPDATAHVSDLKVLGSYLEA